MIIEVRDIGGFRVSVSMEEEAISDPREHVEALTDRDVELWRDDQWMFVSVTVWDLCSCIAGHDHLGNVRDSLGMVMYGDGDGWSVSMDDLYNTYPVPGMLAALKGKE